MRLDQPTVVPQADRSPVSDPSLVHQERAIRAMLSDKVSDVESTIEELATRFLNTTRLYSRQEVLASPSPIPITGGVSTGGGSTCHQRS